MRPWSQPIALCSSMAPGGSTSEPSTTKATGQPPVTSGRSQSTGAEGTLWYFAEGYTGDGWETRTFLLNDGGSTANVSVTYLLEGGGTVTKDVVLAPESRTELLANNAGEGPGNDAAFGMRIVSDQPITAQQSLLDTGAGFSHGSAGSKVLSTNWYFAEGFTGPGWLTFYLRHKPQRHRRQCHR